MSGDVFLAISTANPEVSEIAGPLSAALEVKMHPNHAATALFEATIDATEEAILNALVAGDAAEGANRLYVPQIPHARIKEILRAHNLLREGT